MRTAVIISTRGFGLFRPQLLESRESFRLIGIFSDVDVVNLTQEQRGWYEHIHVVPCGIEDPDPMLASLIDTGAAVAVVGKLLEETPLDELTVHCYDEQNLTQAAEIRTHFGIEGPKTDDVRPFRDKLVMKQRLLDAGVRVPLFGPFSPDRFVTDSPGYFKEISGEVGLPFILKPTDSAGSMGVVKITGYDEFAALPGDFGRPYEYEEFIEGTMYSVNIVSDRGRSVFAGVTEYLVNSMEIPAGKVNADINLIDSDPRVARMTAFGEQALDALGRLDGASHLELFRTADDELVFLEVGARFKGMAGLAAMQRNYAVALVNLAFEIESGIVSRPDDGEQIYCFDGVVPKGRGVIEELLEPRLESDVEMTWTVRVGEEIQHGTSLLANAGTFLVLNKDYEAAYRDFQQLADFQPIRYRRIPRTLSVPPAAPDDAVRYFQDVRLSCETDPYDVHHDIEQGEDGFVVLDARRTTAFEMEHVPGALSLPHQDITAETVAHLDRSVLCVTYGWGPACNGGTRAAAKLAVLGFQVKEMIGGLEYWKRAEYPTLEGDRLRDAP